MDENIARATISIDADVSGAVTSLNNLNQTLTRITPGGNIAAEMLRRLGGGFYQLVQGTASIAYSAVTEGFAEMAKSGLETATAVEKASVAFKNLLPETDNYRALMRDIEKNAVKTPFNVSGLAQGVQRLALVTKNGKEAERTILNVGKAVAAAGGSTAELNRISSNLQQIGNNAKITARDIREFGNAGIPIYELVADYANIAKTEVTDFLQKSANPYAVITAAINAAGEGMGRYADMYESSSETIGQITENLTEGIGLFVKDVMNASGFMDKLKASMQALAENFIDPQFVGTVADSFRKLTDSINGVEIIEKVLGKIQAVLAAFNAGQFDNIVVFFRTFFNTLKQFSGVSFVGNLLKVIIDLFSDNHTAEEVARVASQLATLVRVLLEFKVALRITSYITTLFNGLTSLTAALPQLISGFNTFKIVMSNLITTAQLHPIMTLITLIGALIAVIGMINPNIFAEIGEAIAEGFSTAIYFLSNIVDNFKTIGNNIITGLWNGLVDGMGKVTNAIKDFAIGLVNGVKRVLGIASPSKVFRDEVGYWISVGIAEGILKGYDSVADAYNDVMEELVSLQGDWVDELNDLGALDLVQSLAQLREFAQLYDENSKARLAADKKVHDYEVKSLKEIKKLVDEYNKAYEKSYQKAKMYYDLFEYTQGVLSRDTWSVIEGLERQNRNISEYYENLLKVSQLGFDQDFLQELMEEGIDAASSVAGLADSTQEEVEKINELWATRGALASKIAVLNTKKLKDETLDQVHHLQTGLRDSTAEVYDTGTLLSYNLGTGILDGAPTIWDAIREVGAKSTKKAKDAAEEMEEVYTGVVDDIAENFTGLAEKLNIDIFDTTDALSLVRNILSGIPGYIWAIVAAITAVNIIKWIANLKELISGLSGAGKAAGDVAQAAGNMASQVGRASQGATTQVLKDTGELGTTAANNVRKLGNTYSELGTKGKQILKPFKTFNTWIQGLNSSIQSVFSVISTTITSFIQVIMDALKTVMGGVGQALAAFLQPLSDPALLKSGLVLIELGGAVLIFAAAAKVLDGVKVEAFQNLAIVATIMAALGVVAAAISKISTDIILGAAAIAVIGAGIVIAAAGIKTAADLGAQINIAGLLILSVVTALAGAIMALIAPWIEFIGIGAIATAAIGAGLAVAAVCLGLASAAVDSIDYGKLALLELDILLAGVIMAALGLFVEFIGVGAIATAAIGAGLLVAAVCLAEASKTVSDINYDQLVQLEGTIALAGLIMGAIGLFGEFITVGALVTTVISGGLLVAAIALAEASRQATDIDTNALHTIEGATTLASLIMSGLSGLVIFAGGGILVAIETTAALADCAYNLAQASIMAAGIDITALQKVQTAIDTVATFDFGKLRDNTNNAKNTNAIAAMTTFIRMIVANIADCCTMLATVDKYTDGKIDTYIEKTMKIVEKLRDFVGGDYVTQVEDLRVTSVLASMAKIIREIIKSISECIAALVEIKDKYNVNDVNGAVTEVLKIVEALRDFSAGKYYEESRDAKTSEEIAKLAEHIRDIIKNISEAVSVLYNLEAETGGYKQVQEYVEQVKEIATLLSGIEFKDEEGNDIGKDTVKKYAETAEQIGKLASNLQWITTSVKDTINNLSQFDSLDTSQITGYIERAETIAQQFAKIDFKDIDVNKSAEAVEKIAGLAGNVSSIVAVTKTVVGDLKELFAGGDDVKTVTGYVDQANTIVAEFGKLALEENTEDAFKKTAENAQNVSQTASSVESIITSVKSICEGISGFIKNGIYDEIIAENGYIQKANEIVSKLGELALPNKTDGYYEKLKNNLSHLKEAVGTTKDIISGMGQMIEEIDKFYSKYIQNNSIGDKINNINTALSYITGDDTEGKPGISVQKNGVSSLTSQQLGYVKDTVIAVKDIASAMNQVEDVAPEKLTNIQGIIDFINTKMVGLKDTLQTYVEDFQLQGEAYVTAFINGWNSVAGGESVAEAGHNLQSAIWQAVEGKMPDELEQGKHLVEQIINGIAEKTWGDGGIEGAGSKVQSAFWWGITNHLDDEYWQGVEMAGKVMAGINSKTWGADTEGTAENAGMQIVNGLASGINNNLRIIENAAWNLSDIAINKVRKLLKIESPSKVFAELGAYVAEGFADGISDNLDGVADAGSALADAVVDGYQKAVAPLETSMSMNQEFAVKNKTDAETQTRGTSVGAGKNVTINQTNNVYDGMDESRIINDLTWAINHS